MTDTATLSEFAELLGRSPSYVTKLKQQGRLVLDGKRVKVAASRKLIEQTESGSRPDVKDRHAEQRGEPLPLAPAAEGGELPDDAEPAEGSRAYWERMDRKEIAIMRQMERRKLEGDLVDRADVDFVLNDYGATLRGLLERLADRLSPQVYPLKTLEETHAAISEASDELQRELAETMKRRMQSMEKINEE
jgi:phage terminase Nu1 subunit (DNA packaging protein)